MTNLNLLFDFDAFHSVSSQYLKSETKSNQRAELVSKMNELSQKVLNHLNDSEEDLFEDIPIHELEQV